MKTTLRRNKLRLEEFILCCLPGSISSWVPHINVFIQCVTCNQFHVMHKENPLRYSFNAFSGILCKYRLHKLNIVYVSAAMEIFWVIIY